MYHISKDVRAVKSAELIWDGMEKCLAKKDFSKLRISDISEQSYVSRATFYRLFDSLEDVLRYRCDLIYTELSEEMVLCSSPKNLVLLLIQKWLEQKTLINALVQNHLIGIIYDAHIKHTEMIESIFLCNYSLSQKESDYLVSILVNMIPAAIKVWYDHGQTESPEEIYQMAGQSIRVIADTLSK